MFEDARKDLQRSPTWIRLTLKAKTCVIVRHGKERRLHGGLWSQTQECLQSPKLFLIKLAVALSLWNEHALGKYTLWSGFCWHLDRGHLTLALWSSKCLFEATQFVVTCRDPANCTSYCRVCRLKKYEVKGPGTNYWEEGKGWDDLVLCKLQWENHHWDPWGSGASLCHLQ